MPQHEVVYEKELKETPEFQTLHNKYRNTPIKEGFGDFRAFYDWSMANGYYWGAKLERYDTSQPYSPENCFWCAPKSAPLHNYTEQEKQQIVKWNETVNRFRVHYGLEPFPEKVDSEE